MTNVTSECQMITNYIIDKTNEFNTNKKYSEQIAITVKRIQTLLYLIQVEYIKHTGKNIFEDDFYAWPSGPVIPGIYYLYTKFNYRKFFKTEISHNRLAKKKKKIINCVLENTNNIDTFDLVQISRTIDNLWINVYTPYDKDHNQIISKEMLLNYYRNNTAIKSKVKNFVNKFFNNK